MTGLIAICGAFTEESKDTKKNNHGQSRTTKGNTDKKNTINKINKNRINKNEKNKINTNRGHRLV